MLSFQQRHYRELSTILSVLLDLYSLILLLEEFVSICKIILAFENRLLNMKILSKNPEEISLSIDVHIKTNA